MASRLALLTATFLAAAVLGQADTPTSAPSPTASPRPRTPRATKPSGAPSSPTAASPSAAPSKTTGHVFTNEDLPAEPSPAVIASPGPAGTGRGTVTTLPKTATTPGPVPTEAPVPVEQTEPYWRERARAQRETISRTEKVISNLEQRIGELRDDRNPTNLMDPNREQTRQAQIAKAQADLEAARANLAGARQALTNLEEEARRKGIPPGWLSER